MNFEDEPIIDLIKKNNIKEVKSIIDKGYDASINESYALCPACLYGRFDILLLLLKNNNVDPSSNVNYCIRTAYKYEYFDIVNLLWKDNRVKDSLKNDNKKLYDILFFSEMKNKIFNL